MHSVVLEPPSRPGCSVASVATKWPWCYLKAGPHFFFMSTGQGQSTRVRPGPTMDSRVYSEAVYDLLTTSIGCLTMDA